VSDRRRPSRALRVSGRALFGGGPATVVLSPGSSGAGWRWAVGDAHPRPLGPDDLAPLPHRSTLAGRAVLPEHVLAALVMLDVDDCDLRFVDGEAPILDGSAAPWVAALRAAGIRGPSTRPGLSVSVDVGRLRIGWRGGWGPAPARTFIAASYAASTRALFPGARPGCALVLRDGGALYGGRPRLPDEPATHKLVDLLGDLGCWRARGRLHGHLRAADPSHASNPRVIRSALDSGRLRFEADD
jgi:UDP-3-O-[3-hydroxymyristoyl] N-acetylglucosamine deacetylase